MLFRDWTKRILTEELAKQVNPASLIETIAEASREGRIAFYPCSRYTREILKQLRKAAPDLLDSVCGCFDKSPEATAEPGIDVYPLEC